MKSLRKRAVAKSCGFTFKKLNNSYLGECWLFYYSEGMICTSPLSDSVFLSTIKNRKLWNSDYYRKFLHYTIKYRLD